MPKGLFITLEGGEGSGKSTQLKRLAETLRGKGRNVVTTREPGGTPDAEKIRNLLVQRDGGEWTPMAECLLLYASRVMHVEKLIRPALAEGKIVISDRFADSTRAYQAYGHGMNPQIIEQLNALALGDFKPDLTFILDIDAEEGLKRAGHRLSNTASTEDRFERLGIPFHQRLRMGFLEIAQKEPDRCMVINAAREPDDVAKEIEEKVFTRL